MTLEPETIAWRIGYENNRWLEVHDDIARDYDALVKALKKALALYDEGFFDHGDYQNDTEAFDHVQEELATIRSALGRQE